MSVPLVSDEWFKILELVACCPVFTGHGAFKQTPDI